MINNNLGSECIPVVKDCILLLTTFFVQSSLLFKKYFFIKKRDLLKNKSKQHFYKSHVKKIRQRFTSILFNLKLK